MAQTLPERLEKIERQLHVAERLAARSGNSTEVASERVRRAVAQARHSLVCLKIDIEAGRLPQCLECNPRQLT